MVKFLKCELCGNIVTYLEDSGVVPQCCGQEMTMLEPKCEDEGLEKHVPVIIRNGLKVVINVGSTLHPMEKDHYIRFIVLETNIGLRVTTLRPGEEPSAEFVLSSGESIMNVYEYCNVHGLWKASLYCDQEDIGDKYGCGQGTCSIK